MLARRIEGFYALPRGIGISDVVVRKLFALQLRVSGQAARRGLGLAIKRRRLMRIFAIAHLLHFLKLRVEDLRKGALGGHRLQVRQRGKVIADRTIISRCMAEDFFRQGKARGAQRCALTCCHLAQDDCVVRRVHQHGHVFPIFGGRAQHRRATDVDVFNRVVKRAIGLGNRLGEGIQINHHQINRRDLMRLHQRHMLRQPAPPQQAAMNFGVQGFHAPIEHFRKAGVLRYIRNRQALLTQKLGSAAGREQLHAVRVQGCGKFSQARLV